jgi:hypothetical protein
VPPRLSAYPPELSLDVREPKNETSVVPKLVMMKTVAVAIPPTMRVYSIPVIPVWSVRN